jgi:tetratricopeptide (TPR) repeat protein
VSIRAIFLFTALLAFTASPALADRGGESTEASAAEPSRDDEMARTLFETGRAYFERAKCDEAAEAFGEAYRLSGRVTLLVNQARALEAAGRFDAAIVVLETFLEIEREEEAARESVNAMLRRLRAAASRQAAGTEAQGEQEPEEVTVELEAPLEVEAAPAPEKRSLSRILGWSAISFGGLSGVLALGTGVAARGKLNTLESECPMDVCSPELQGAIDKGNRLAVTSTVFTFVGVAAAASGVLVLVLKKDRSDDPEATKVELTPGPAASGAGLRVTF